MAASLGLEAVAEYHVAGPGSGSVSIGAALQEAQEHIREGRAETLVCADPSRLSRDRLRQAESTTAIKAVGGSVALCHTD